MTLQCAPPVTLQPSGHVVMICAVPSGQVTSVEPAHDDAPAVQTMGRPAMSLPIARSAPPARSSDGIDMSSSLPPPPPPPSSPRIWKLHPAKPSKAKNTYFMCSSMRYHLGVLGAIIRQPLEHAIERRA